MGICFRENGYFISIVMLLNGKRVHAIQSNEMSPSRGLKNRTLSPQRSLGVIPPSGPFLRAIIELLSPVGGDSVHAADATIDNHMTGRIAMTRAAIAASVVMFSVPFLLLAACYAALPDELTVLRNPMGGAVLLAPKSLFTVFRVPLMNLTHGLMAAVMLSCTADFKDAQRRVSYSRVFLTLLFAVALKSNFEALEISGLAWSFGPVVPWWTRGTVLSVVGGLGLAFAYARGVPIPWPELRLTKLGKITLTCLFAAYLSIVTATLLISHRG